jgi:cytoskeletal protein RodZ
MISLAILKVVPARVWIIAAVVLGLIGYHWLTVATARKEGEETHRAKVIEKTQERINNAVEAETRARDRLPADPGGMPDNDGFRRD